VVAGDLDQNEIVDNAKRGARDDRAHRWLGVFIVASILFTGALLVVVVVLFNTSSDLRTENVQIQGEVGSIATQQAQAAVAGQKLAAQLKGLGVTPVVTPPTPVTGQQGLPGPGPSQAEIDASVSRYFATHPLPPGQLPPVSEVAGLVAQYLVTNPPAPGQNATPLMVSDAVTGYCTAHNGCAGADGQNATDEQVATQVSAYCATHNDCAGASGKDGQNGAAGPQGVSITDLVFQRDSSGTCQAIVTLHDPATGTDNTVSHPAGDAACPLVTTPLIHGK
jgi:hypothetical protein